MGNAFYMPPEYFRGENASLAGDIWAVGCILYETITGTVLFRAPLENSIEEISDRVLHQAPPKLPSCYSKSFRQLVWCMLRQKPRERPSANQTLKSDLF
jgi:serine/threonine protein kinase